MTFGLLGYPLTHSFSRGYFTDKFERLGLAATHRYLNFSVPTVADVRALPEQYPDLRGLNVTAPHKQAVLAHLDALDPVAERIGAVNTILIDDGRWTGYNTDYVGFRDDLLMQWNMGEDAGAVLSEKSRRPAALVLGTGGASRAILAALSSLDVAATLVSRTPAADRLTYGDLSPTVLANYQLLVNTTPLGTYPRVEDCPPLPYTGLTADHFCYDLVYNPPVTEFLRRSADRGAGTANGLGMLHGQAEAAWTIWTKQDY